MGKGNKIIRLMVSVMFVIGLATPAMALFDNKFEQEMEKEAGAVKLVKEVQRGGYEVMSVSDLKQMMDDGKDLLVIDTMPYEASYQKAHIPGAVQFLFPIPDMETWDTAQTDGKTQEDYAALLGPDKTRTLVVYCGFVKCTRSHNGAVWARKLGYQSVYRCPGGIFAWKGAKFPTDGEEK